MAKKYNELTTAELNSMNIYFEAVQGMILLLDEDKTSFMDDSEKKEMFQELQNVIHLLRSTYGLDV